ncbi:PhzF family phenazine biosynthesis isomerase [Cohnella sp. CFH 77786]|uniref:PhzF family phenazine biosynthesis isomerase n=1 Tax=Cohnella sp. CFH 77786 TaxID=2662265 RepID=UPI001C60E93F|nr:PhzF family phenazine biosynthesis isomerase [Cohnella sp. CFH 77786]MBW5448326.1 PhzF family phenazine biosynthesis isomerase [Cohnella sp. CFH 77786]
MDETKATVLHYEAFSRIPGKGNPAGIVRDADGMPENEMQRIAAAVGFNETTFIQTSETADVRLRYFTPGHEMDLCGHATVATLYHLKTNGWFEGRDRITVETRAGNLPMELMREPEGDWSIRMMQDRPRFEPFGGDRGMLARSIGLEERDLHPELPIMYGSTGIWTLLVPVADLACFSRMKPDNRRFPDILAERPRASVHPFGLATVDPQAHMHARHFSSPYSGTIEDPVTGTASGVMGAYALTYLQPGRESADLIVEQGLEIGRDGRVQVQVRRTEGDSMEVRIIGCAVYVREFEV